MKYFHTIIAASLIASSAWAEGSNAEPIILTTPGEYYVSALSPSGEWACGSYLDYSYESYAFRWNLLSDEIEVLGAAETSEAYSISNDGTVVGCFTSHDVDATGIGYSMAGYYRDGKWHLLELASPNIKDGRAHSISPDGKYIAGMEYDGKTYTSYIWKDGKIYKHLPHSGNAFAYAVSPDGETAGGWIQRSNRTACYWDAKGDVTVLSDHESPWSYANQFTTDGKYLVFYGGWDEDATGRGIRKTIYEIETGKTIAIPTINPEGGLDVYAASDDLTIVGSEDQRGYIYADGKAQYINDYLTDRGVDLSKLGIAIMDGTDYYDIDNVPYISADGKTIALRYASDERNSNGELLGLMRSMVVRFDKDFTLAAPVSLTARQLDGINAARITWKPTASTTNNGYNLFRNGEKVNDAAITTTSYIDTGLETGDYTYTVTAIYADGESAPSAAANITVEANKIQAPTALFSRQKGYNSAMLAWEAPRTNLIGKDYFDNSTANFQGFGVNIDNINFETAIRFDAEEMAAYQGCQLHSVAFYPMSEQKSWKINVYTYNSEGKLQCLHSETVAQALDYGKRNVVKLAEPVDVPQGELVIGIEVSVPSASESIIGMDYGQAIPQYSDLLRRADEADFYSFSEVNELNGFLYQLSWLIDAVLASKGSDLSVDDVEEYIVTADGNETLRTSTQQAQVAELADGQHTLGVSTRYADGRISEPATITVNIAATEDHLSAVEHVYVTAEGASTIHAKWNAPKDKDLTAVTYASGEITDRGVVAPAENNYGIIAGTIYTPDMLKGYEGYCLNSVSFVPMADATFTIMLFENNVQVAEIEVDDYTISEWNKIKLEEPLYIKANSTYLMAIDCYDVTPNGHAIAIDAGPSVEYYSDLYSLDGASWSSIGADAAIYGNWMIAMDIFDAKAGELPVKGYDVYIDGEKRNAELLTTAAFDYDFGSEDAEKHTISVDVHYPALDAPVKGAVNTFHIGTAGIGSVTGNAAGMQIEMTEDYIKVAKASHISVVAADGTTVCSTDGERASIAHLTAGIYVVVATVDGKTMERKVSIMR